MLVMLVTTAQAAYSKFQIKKVQCAPTVYKINAKQFYAVTGGM
jgi:hypothetical protein